MTSRKNRHGKNRQYFCYQCIYLTPYKKPTWRGYCNIKKGSRDNGNPGCRYFVAIEVCSLCNSPANPRDGLGICHSCRIDLEKLKSITYKTTYKKTDDLLTMPPPPIGGV